MIFSLQSAGPWVEVNIDEAMHKVSRAIRDAVSYKRGQTKKSTIYAKGRRGKSHQSSANTASMKSSSKKSTSTSPLDLSESTDDEGQTRAIRDAATVEDASRRHDTIFSSRAQALVATYKDDRKFQGKRRISPITMDYPFADPEVFLAQVKTLRNVQTGPRYSDMGDTKPSSLHHIGTEQSRQLCPSRFKMPVEGKDGYDTDDDKDFLGLIDATLGPLTAEEILESNITMEFD
jgi:hypothetical protein